MDQDPYLACETASATTSNSMLTLSKWLYHTRYRS